VVVAGGRVQGVVPKSYLPNYGEFYEARQFSAADYDTGRRIASLLLGPDTVPFGSALLFEAADMPLFRFHVEICEDVWVPVPPSSFAALAGASVLVNLSASNVVVGKSGLSASAGRPAIGALPVGVSVYTSAGRGESSTDLAWDGQAVIYENGELLAESERFLDDLASCFRRRRSRAAVARTHAPDHLRPVGAPPCGRSIEVRNGALQSRSADQPRTCRWTACVERFPYVPSDPKRRDERCNEVYNIQVQALVQRLSASKISKVVIGISGGLDSTHALLVCAKAMDRLKLPRTNILGVTMPGFATSDRTLLQARQLMEMVGCSASEIDIRPSCEQMLKDLGHPYASGKEQVRHHVRERAGRRAHQPSVPAGELQGRIVIGTGDLSELALGWCTYGVGDHMSHYNVNASVPKTLDHASGPVGRGNRASRQLGFGRADQHPEYRHQPGTRAGQVKRQSGAKDRKRHRPVRAAGFQPVLHAALWFRANESRVPGAIPRGRTATRATGPKARMSRATSTPGRPSSTTWAFSSTGSSAPASSSDLACRMRRKSALAVRCRRAATGARRAIRNRSSG
jgi:NAD+ synthase (glutamine-hydrolysing)